MTDEPLTLKEDEGVDYCMKHPDKVIKSLQEMGQVLEWLTEIFKTEDQKD